MIPVLGLRVAFALGAVAFLFGAGWWMRGVKAERDEAAARIAALNAQNAAVAKAMEDGQRRVNALQEVVDAASNQLRRVRDDRATADLASRSLQQHAADLAARAAQAEDAVAGSREAAAAAARVLADVLGRVDERAGILAAVADERAVAGAACERAYDEVTR